MNANTDTVNRYGDTRLGELLLSKAEEVEKTGGTAWHTTHVLQRIQLPAGTTVSDLCSKIGLECGLPGETPVQQVAVTYSPYGGEPGLYVFTAQDDDFCYFGEEDQLLTSPEGEPDFASCTDAEYAEAVCVLDKALKALTS